MFRENEFFDKEKDKKKPKTISPIVSNINYDPISSVSTPAEKTSGKTSTETESKNIEYLWPGIINKNQYKNMADVGLSLEPIKELGIDRDALSKLINERNNIEINPLHEILGALGTFFATDDNEKDSLNIARGLASSIYKNKLDKNESSIRNLLEQSGISKDRGSLLAKSIDQQLIEPKPIITGGTNTVVQRGIDSGGSLRKDTKLSEKSQWKNAQELGAFNSKIKEYASKVRKYGWQPFGEQSKELANLRSLLSTESQRLMKQGVLREGDKPYIDALLTNPDTLIKGGIEEIAKGGNEGRMSSLKQAYDYFEALRQGNLSSLKIDYPEEYQKIQQLERVSNSGTGRIKRKITTEDINKMSKEELKKYLGE